MLFVHVTIINHLQHAMHKMTAPGLPALVISLTPIPRATAQLVAITIGAYALVLRTPAAVRSNQPAMVLITLVVRGKTHPVLISSQGLVQGFVIVPIPPPHPHHHPHHHHSPPQLVH